MIKLDSVKGKLRTIKYKLQNDFEYPYGYESWIIEMSVSLHVLRNLPHNLPYFPYHKLII